MFLPQRAFLSTYNAAAAAFDPHGAARGLAGVAVGGGKIGPIGGEVGRKVPRGVGPVEGEVRRLVGQ